MIKEVVSVENPIYEDWVLDSAMHEMTMRNLTIFMEFRGFQSEAEYKERWNDFKKRFRVVKTEPRVIVDKDGCYRVDRVLVTLIFKEITD